MASIEELSAAVEALQKVHEDSMKQFDAEREQLVTKGDLDPLMTAATAKAQADYDAKWDTLNKLQKEAKAEAEAKQAADEKRIEQLEAAIKRSGPFNVETPEAKEHRRAVAQYTQMTTKSLVLEDSDDLDFDGYAAYQKGFSRYLRTNELRGWDVHSDEAKALTSGGDPQGGYFVEPAIGNRIIGRIFESSPVRGEANVITIGTDRVIFPIDRQEGSTGWVGEVEARSETDTPEIGELEIAVHEQYANPRVSQNLLDDSAFDVAGWLQNKVADKLARTENTAFITGDGIKKPRGVLDYAAAAVTTADAARAFGVLQYIITGVSGGFHATLPGDALINAVYELKAHYRQGAKWSMARSTLGGVRKLKDGQGNYLWTPNFQDLQATMLLGFPVVEMEDITAIAANSFSILFGNWDAGYQIVDRQGVRVLVDPYTDKPYVRYYTTKRVGGDVVDSEALKLIKFGTS